MRKRIICVLLAIVMVVSILPVISLKADAAPGSDFDFTEDGIGSGFSGETETRALSEINGEDVIQNMIDMHGRYAHPRIIMTEEKFAKLRMHIDDGSLTAKLLVKLRAEADSLLTQPVSEYEIPDGIRLLETSRKILRRIGRLGLAYNIFKDEKYAIRCYAELEAASNFQDWNPRHFLDPSEMSAAFALGYDWLYQWMDEGQRTLIRTAMIEKGLSQVMEDYEDKPRTRTYKWYQDPTGDNWKMVCNGGMSMAALAIGDETDAGSIAAEVLSYAYKDAYAFIRRSYNEQDGTYSEGLGYWNYATYYLGLYASSLISATGTDYGLAGTVGLRKSADFVRYMCSNTYNAFSFGDSNVNEDVRYPVLLWLGEYFDAYELSAMRVEKLKAGSFDYLDILWLDEERMSISTEDIPTDWGDVGGANASFRNTWSKNGIVAAFHVGTNNYKYHGHYDLGSFYIDSNGKRFFVDLGNEWYELPNRRHAYRIRAEGHNTLAINPSDIYDQEDGAECLISHFGSGNEAYAVSDLTDAYEPSGAESVVRGLKMIKDKQCVIIQDEISLTSPGEIYWFAHTTANTQIDVSGDGKNAILSLGTDRLWVGIVSENGTFTVMNAESLPTTPAVPGQSDNSAYKKLSIHLTNTKDTTISVACIPLNQGETQPLWTPSAQAISEWIAGTHEHDHQYSITDNTITETCSGCELNNSASILLSSDTYTGSEITLSVEDDKLDGSVSIDCDTIRNAKDYTATINGQAYSFSIRKAANAPNMPEATINPEYFCDKVSGVGLPEGWEWDSSDKEKALEPGVGLQATANYVGADAGNYENETVQITILINSANVTPCIVADVSKLYEPWGLRFFATYTGEDIDHITNPGIAVLKDDFYTEDMTAEEFCSSTNAIIYTSADGNLDYESDTERYYATLSDGIYPYNFASIYYAVPFAEMDNGQVIYGDIARNAVDTGFGANLSAYSFGRSVTLTWKAIEGADGYEIFRCDRAGQPYNRIAETGANETSYIDSGLFIGTTYYYNIRAYIEKTNGARIYSDMNDDSAAVKVSIESTTPTITSVSTDTNKATISWNKVTGATSYRIFRADTKTGAKALLKAVNATTYTDTTAVTGKTYYYFVSAYSSTIGVLSDYSAAKEVTVKAPAPIAAPTISSAVTDTNKVTLSWNSITGATSYRIFRADTKTGAKALLKAVNATTYTDTTAVTGKTYYYFVSAYSSTIGVLSAYSAAKEVTVNNPVAISAPVISSVSTNTNKVTINWDKVTGATGYRVYRITDGTRRELARVTATTYVDTTVTTGKMYHYEVKAYNGTAGILSAYSAKRAVKVIAAPVITSANVSPKITWSKVADATSYRVFRTDVATGKRILLKAVGVSTTSYTDDTAESGKTYIYYVRAYSGNASTLSDYSTGRRIKVL